MTELQKAQLIRLIDSLKEEVINGDIEMMKRLLEKIKEEIGE